MRILLAVVTFFSCVNLWSQQKPILLDWDKLMTLENGKIVHNEKHLTYLDSKSFVYLDQWEVTSSFKSQSVQIASITFESIPQDVLSKLEKKRIPQSLDFTLSSSRARDIYYAVLQMNPFVNDNGQYKRVKEIRFEYAFAKAATNPNNLPITNSVLATGSYYKFYVEKTGVHRITRNFLEDLGVSLSGIDPSKIKVLSLIHI